MKVLAIDPGERVGWAVGTVREDRDKVRFAKDQSTEEHERRHLDVDTHGITALKPFALKLFEVAGNYDVIVYEHYRIGAKYAKAHIGSDVPTLQLIGMIRAAAWLNPQVKLVQQNPANMSTADRTMPDDLRDRIAALPAAHDDSHDGSALRHLWFWHWKNNL